ncbi:MAG: SDR family oxidoreductase [Chloroflexota bacterium]|nr:MAG: SDR family oxidoreductase [Chloroflexota bacterium]
MGTMMRGRAAVVTGAGRGIGRGIAIALAKQGAAVVVGDLGASLSGEGTDVQPAQRVVDEIRAAGGEAIAHYGDVSDFEQGADLVEMCVKQYGKVDAVVNCAGNLRDRMIFNISEDEWDAVIAVHLKGTFNVTRAASIHMRERGYGRIVSMSSSSALGAAGQPNYAAAKAGIMGLMWSCANGLRKYNVTANSVMPSGVTRMIDSTPRGRQVHQETGNWPSEMAVGTEGDPDNVAPLVVYLCSEQSASVSGQVFHSTGYQIVRMEMPRFVRALRGTRRWEPEEIAEWFPRTLADGGLAEPPAAGGFGERLRAMSDEEFSELADGVLFWRASNV